MEINIVLTKSVDYVNEMTAKCDKNKFIDWVFDCVSLFMDNLCLSSKAVRKNGELVVGFYNDCPPCFILDSGCPELTISHPLKNERESDSLGVDKSKIVVVVNTYNDIYGV